MQAEGTRAGKSCQEEKEDDGKTKEDEEGKEEKKRKEKKHSIYSLAVFSVVSPGQRRATQNNWSEVVS